MRGLVLAGVAVMSALVLAGEARAYGGDYVFEGGSAAARNEVRLALEASRFDWGLVPGRITIRIADCGCGGASPGEIVLDENVLTGDDYGPDYAWGLIQHEYAHQVAYLLLDGPARRRVRAWLGGSDWCYEQTGVAHDEHACERFASSLAWAYWPRRRNIMAAESVVSAREFRDTFAAILQGLQERSVQRRLPSGQSSTTLRQVS